jgi:hypothetical protein
MPRLRCLIPCNAVLCQDTLQLRLQLVARNVASVAHGATEQRKCTAVVERIIISTATAGAAIMLICYC